MRPILVLIMITLPVLAQDSREPLARYPSWFLTMPSDPEGVYAVGYAPVYAIFDSSVEEAGEKACIQLMRTKQIHISGERLFEVIPGGQNIFRGELFEETYPDCEDYEYVVLDTVRVNNMVLVLVTNKEEYEFTGSYLVPLSHHAPKWVTDTSNLHGNLYAVGASPLYFYEQNAWLEAERQARHQLAFSAATQQRQLFKGTQDQEFVVTASATSVKLFNAQVVERWRNNRMIFVLMRADGFEIKK